TRPPRRAGRNPRRASPLVSCGPVQARPVAGDRSPRYRSVKPTPPRFRKATFMKPTFMNVAFLKFVWAGPADSGSALRPDPSADPADRGPHARSEEHTSELQSR